MWRSKSRVALFAIDAFAAVTAIGVGIALATKLEGDLFPPHMLLGTPFADYVVPGIILAGVVGGSAAIATAATWRDPQSGAGVSVVAGAVMIGWIAGEVALLNQEPAWTTTEAVYLSVGAAMAGLGLIVARGA